MLSSTFSGGGDDEGSVAANSVMHASADGNRGLEGTRSFVGTAEGSAGARCSSSSPSSSSFSTSSSSDDSSSELSLSLVRLHQIESDTLHVPSTPHQKLTGILWLGTNYGTDLCRYHINVITFPKRQVTLMHDMYGCQLNGRMARGDGSIPANPIFDMLG
ncbi:hypothetical protein Tco_0706599 [Tanacetum coccineum]|uniref:Uncharacterized protein n=1 Tax=Tanacetum coccineum TaxID=301880 RepID=A0ABQ4Y9Z6_9ASTR